MRKRPYVQWERQAQKMLLGYDGYLEGNVALVRPVARALRKAFARGYARASERRKRTMVMPVGAWPAAIPERETPK